jgi:hypothetical protein
MTLPADEFLRRFLLHVLTDSFQRIRYYGLFGNRHRSENLARCRELLAMPAPVPQPPRDHRERCQQLIRVRSVAVPAVQERPDGANRHPSRWPPRPNV